MGAKGARRIPLKDFYRNDGIDRIALRSDELLVAVRVPPQSAGRRGVYHKLRLRNSIDYPLAGVAVSMDVDAARVCRSARVAVTGVNPAPLLVPQASEWLVGRKCSPELIGRVAHPAVQTGQPLTPSSSPPAHPPELVPF